MRRASASSTRRPRSPDAPVFEDELRLLLRDDVGGPIDAHVVAPLRPKSFNPIEPKPPERNKLGKVGQLIAAGS